MIILVMSTSHKDLAFYKNNGVPADFCVFTNEIESLKQFKTVICQLIMCVKEVRKQCLDYSICRITVEIDTLLE